MHQVPFQQPETQVLLSDQLPALTSRLLLLIPFVALLCNPSPQYDLVTFNNYS